MKTSTLFLYLALLPCMAQAVTLLCTTVEEIYAAMNNVEAGDEIVIAPGFYLADDLAIYGTGAHFASYTDGTEEDPIVMRSQDPNNPAILSGEDAGSLACVRIFGAFWTILDLVVTNAQKGIVFDNAPFGQVINCTVHGIGYEAIHWRDGSDFGLIEGCRIYDTGIRDPGFGEAIYIGTDKGSWGKYDRDVTYVTIRYCDIGPGIAAEAFDIKEGTEEIVVEYNTIDATGISNANYADSFIDLKGTRAYVRYNIFVRNGETKLTRGIAVIDRGVALSSYEHAIHDNFFSMDADGSDINMVDAYSGTSDVFAWNNVRDPLDGDTYSTSVHDFCCPYWYTPPDDGTCYAPVQFAASQITNTSALFSWDGGELSIYYTIAYEVSGSGEPVGVSDLTSETYSLEGLEPDTIYLAQIQATCESDSSTYSTQVAFRTLSNDNIVGELPDPPSEGVVVIYDDALAFGWSEHSFSGTYDLAHSVNTREGLFSIEAIAGNYGGLQLKHDGLDASSFSYVKFWIRDDASNGPNSPDIELEVGSMTLDFKIENPGWNFMLIPIDMNSIPKIVLQNRSPNLRTFYVDAIELWPELDAPSVSPVTPAPVVPTPAPILPETPAPVIPQTPAPTTPAPIVPETPAPVIPQTPAPTTSAPIVPETPAPVVPQTPAPIAPESPAPVVSQTPAPIFTTTPAPVVSETPAPVVTVTPAPAVPPTLSPISSQTPAPVVAPSPSPVASVGEVVYGDQLGSEWSDYSFKGSFTFDSTNEIYEGSSSILADIYGWGALHLKDNSGLDTTGLSSLSFFVKATGPSFTLRVKVNGKQENLSLPDTGEWTNVVLSLSLFDSPSSISTITFQNNSGSRRTYYFDRITLI